MQRLYDEQGRAVTLGREIARGGEGAVYEVAGNPNVVAKLYLKSLEAWKVDKYKQLPPLVTNELLKVSAWPTGFLSKNFRNDFAGIILPKIVGHREIHQLYSPAQRKIFFPTSDWSLLVHIAMNLAGAFETVHNHGHVIGDVNQGGIFVSGQANSLGTVRLIDCDSFQVRQNGHLYHCDVAVSEYTPPELVGVDLRKTERTQQHDCFGLAVLIFRLLFMGRHPYAGCFSGTGEMSLERAISESRFAFSRSASSYKMAPPPNAITIGVLPPGMAGMFEDAFATPNGKRPLASVWWRELKHLKDILRKCPDDASHVFPGCVSDCPWCEIEVKGGPAFFVSQTASFEFDVAFDLEKIYPKILAFSLSALRTITLPHRPRNLTATPLPPDASPERMGSMQVVPPEPICNLEPLPPIPTYQAAFLPSKPPFELEPVIDVPDLIVETVAHNPILNLKQMPMSPIEHRRDHISQVKAAYRGGEQSFDSRLTKWLSVCLLPLIVLSALWCPIEVFAIAFLIWGAFFATWLMLFLPQRMRFLNDRRRAEKKMEHERKCFYDLLQAYQKEKKETEWENERRQLAWRAEVGRLDSLRAGLAERNEERRLRWNEDKARTSAERSAVVARNKARLDEWKLQVKTIEAGRIADWEESVRKVERERTRIGTVNSALRKTWQDAMNRHREIRLDVEAHNAAIEYARKRFSYEMESRTTTLNALESQLASLTSDWSKQIRDLEIEMEAVKQESERSRSEYHALKSAFEKERDSMSQHQLGYQLDAFLGTVFIEDETIDGIGKGRKATLSAYGIETAFDITYQSVANVPGFGPALEGSLIAWRQSVEKRFRFDPQKVLTAVDLRTLHMKYHSRRKGLQRVLHGGEERLLEIGGRANKAFRLVQIEVQKLVPLVAQAEVNVVSFRK